MDKQYYSARTGKNKDNLSLDLDTFKDMFHRYFDVLDEKGYFDESFGYYCVDKGHVPGKTIYKNIYDALLIETGNNDFKTSEYKRHSEETTFDLVEFLYDYVSKPLEGKYHEFDNCGWHYFNFDKSRGQEEYLKYVNELLAKYGTGYELTKDGEILIVGEDELNEIFVSELPNVDNDNIKNSVDRAIKKFRRYKSNEEDRKDAIRDLADVLEFLKRRYPNVLNKQDDSDLFNIINRFSIRHHNPDQVNNYDKPIWYNWMFYFFLSTIHAYTRFMIKKYPELGV